MKKWLIYLCLLFSFLFINNVKAYDLYSYDGEVYNEEKITSIFQEAYPDIDIDLSDKYVMCSNTASNNTSSTKTPYFDCYVSNMPLEFIQYNQKDITNTSGGSMGESFKVVSSALNPVYDSTYTYYSKLKYYPSLKKIGSKSNEFKIHETTYSSSSYYDISIYITKENGILKPRIYANYPVRVANLEPITPNLDFGKSKKYNVTFHLNEGYVFNENIECDDFSCTVPIYNYEDFSVDLSSTQLSDYIKKLTPNKATMIFDGWYYDDKFENPYYVDDVLKDNINLYAKWRYENVDDFLNNTNFIEYDFDTNYQYAIISKGDKKGDIYLGLNYLTYNLELLNYDNINKRYDANKTVCINSIYSKDNIYYYLMDTALTKNYEVLVLPKSTFEKGSTPYYKFLLSDNAYVTYTNDLSKAEIYDEEGNKFETDMQDIYQDLQNSLIGDEKNLLTIFKNLLKFKDNKVFRYVVQIWNMLKSTDLYNYFVILIIGGLIILIIKSAKRS